MGAIFKTELCLIGARLAVLVMGLPQFVLGQEFGFDAEEKEAAAVTTEETLGEGDSNALYRAQWVVPPSFIIDEPSSGSSDGSVDPFADPESSETTVRVLKTGQEILEDAGISFPLGTSAKYFSHTKLLVVENTLDQLELVDAYIGWGCYCTEKQIYIFVEWIEVKAADYHDWMFENRITRDGTALRKQAQKWVKAGEGTILETAAIVCRSGQRAKTESHSAVIYPNHSDPPQVPKKVLLEGKNQTSPITGAIAGATDVRNVGTIVEVDPVLGADEFTIDLSLAPEIVSRNGFTHWPPESDESQATVSIPIFHTMKTSTQVTLHSGRYAILGTTRRVNDDGETDRESIVLSFVRGDVSRVGAEPAVPVNQVKIKKIE